MKTSKLIITALILVIPFFMFAQSPVGKWTYNLTQADGTTVPVQLNFGENGTLQVDIGEDGTIDIQCTYTVEGKRFSVKEITSGGDCYGIVGVYEMAKIKGGTNTNKLYAIDDPCESRRMVHDGITVTQIE